MELDLSFKGLVRELILGEADVVVCEMLWLLRLFHDILLGDNLVFLVVILADIQLLNVIDIWLCVCSASFNGSSYG